MQNFTQTFLLIALLSLFFCYSLGYHPAAETPPKLRRNSCDKIRETFAKTLLSFDTPGGMVILDNSNCEGVSYFDSKAKDTDSLKERLDILVEEAPTFRWRKRDGVVNFEPRDTKVVLLDTKVAHFVYTTDSNSDSILDSLKQTSEVRREIERKSLLDGPYFGGLHSPPSKKSGTEVILRDKSVRQILNDIVKRRGRGLWVYSERLVDHSHRFTLQFIIK